MSSNNISKDTDCLNVDGNPFEEKKHTKNIMVSISEDTYNIEEPYATTVNSSNKEFSPKSSLTVLRESFKGDSIISMDNEGIANEDPAYTTVLFSGNMPKSITTESCYEEGNYVKDEHEMEFNANLMLQNIRNYPVCPDKAQFITATYSGALSENSEAEESQTTNICRVTLFDNRQEKPSTSGSAVTSAVKRNVSRVTRPKLTKIKLKKSCSFLTDNIPSDKNQLIGNPQTHPPITVRKISPINNTSTMKDQRKLCPKLSKGFSKLNSQHSAHCMKQGQIKCDFVCSLYKSQDWASGSSVQNCVCNFCKKLYGWEGMTCLKLHMPLPSSFIDPITLLRYYGFTFFIPKYIAGESDDNALLNICQKCYDLVLDGDLAYKKMLYVAKEMRQSWPKEAVCSGTFPPIQECVVENGFEYTSLTQASKSREGSINTVDDKRTCVRKYPFILPRSTTSTCRQDKLGQNNPSDAFSLKSDDNIPKRVRTKPLTCGFCGLDFFLEDQWKYHMQQFHRVQQKWCRFTPNMHNKLRTKIIYELSKSTYQTKLEPQSSNINSLCCACDTNFIGHTLFLVHLREYHKITIDDDLVSSENGNIQTNLGNDNEREEKLYHEPKEVTDVDKIFGSCDVKESLHTAIRKSKDPDGSDVDDALEMVNYESNEDGILSNTLNYKLKQANICKTFDNKDFNFDNCEMKNQIHLDTDILCLICNEKFTTKKDLEKHVESTHLTSIILKGDGNGGVLDCNVDTHNFCRSIKEEKEEANLGVDGENGTSLPVEWEDEARDNKNPSLSENKETLIRCVGKDEGIPHCLLYECQICGRRITGKKLLYNHLKRIHKISMNMDEDPFYYCKFCLFRTEDRAVLMEHKKEKHGECKGTTQRQCETCGKIYSSTYIQEHVAVVHGNDRKFACDFCGMKFLCKKSVKSHIYYEHANKQWKCEKCDITFKKYHQLRQHTLYFHSNKEHKCEKCSKSFKRKGDLTDHMKRSHEQITSICKYCSRQYRNPYKYRSHLVNVHGVSKEDTYSHRYARHKRANSKLHEHSSVVNDTRVDKVTDTEKGSEGQESCIVMKNEYSSIEKNSLSIKNGTESEFQVVEVMEATNNELEMEEVTLLIFS